MSEDDGKLFKVQFGNGHKRLGTFQKVNMYIKEVCELTKIDSLVKIIKCKGNERIEKTLKIDVIITH